MAVPDELLVELARLSEESGRLLNQLEQSQPNSSEHRSILRRAQALSLKSQHLMRAARELASGGRIIN